MIVLSGGNTTALCFNIKPDVITYPEYDMVSGKRVVQDASRSYEHVTDCRKLKDFEKFKLEHTHNYEQF